MERWLCLGSLGIAGLLSLIFLLDLFTGLFFGSGGQVKFLDICMLIGAGILAYLAYDTLKEMK